MARNGSGTYTLPAGNPVVTGTTISSSVNNTTMSDIATALTASIAADGQTPVTANIPMNSKKITGLAAATTSGDALSYGQPATLTAGAATQLILDSTAANIESRLTFKRAGTVVGLIGNAGAAGDLINDSTQGDQMIRVETHDIRLSTNAGLSSALVLTSDGRLYGKFLHNNAGAMTGATNQYVGSGTYTPTVTAIANITASTAQKCLWIRVGNIVYVAGSVQIDPTASATNTTWNMTLPIASNLATNQDLSGTLCSNNVSAAGASGIIFADTAGDRANMQCFVNDASNVSYLFNFSYEVL